MKLLQLGVVDMKAEGRVVVAEFEGLVVQHLQLMFQVVAGNGLPWKKTAVVLLAGVEPQRSPACHEELEYPFEPARVSATCMQIMKHA